MLLWTIVSRQIVGNCQTLTLYNVMQYVGLSGHTSSQNQANIYPIVGIISTRHLEIFFWRARSDSQTYSFQCLLESLD